MAASLLYQPYYGPSLDECIRLFCGKKRPDPKPINQRKARKKKKEAQIMSENLMSTGHKSTTPESRENHALIWSRRCEYHGGRPGVVLHDGVWLCEECALTEEVCA